jgi:hypothetical protein
MPCRPSSLPSCWRSWPGSTQTLVPLAPAEGCEPLHAAWIARAGEVTVRRLGEDVEHALAARDFDPGRLPALPDLGVPADRTACPAGVQIGAQRTHAQTDVSSAKVPSDLARLFRADRQLVGVDAARVRRLDDALRGAQPARRAWGRDPHPRPGAGPAPLRDAARALPLGGREVPPLERDSLTPRP